MPALLLDSYAGLKTEVRFSIRTQPKSLGKMKSIEKSMWRIQGDLIDIYQWSVMSASRVYSLLKYEQ
jgi:hypothetical protein